MRPLTFCGPHFKSHCVLYTLATLPQPEDKDTTDAICQEYAQMNRVQEPLSPADEQDNQLDQLLCCG